MRRRTKREQLRGDLPQSAQTLGDRMSCKQYPVQISSTIPQPLRDCIKPGRQGEVYTAVVLLLLKHIKLAHGREALRGTRDELTGAGE